MNMKNEVRAYGSVSIKELKQLIKQMKQNRKENNQTMKYARLPFDIIVDPREDLVSNGRYQCNISFPYVEA